MIERFDIAGYARISVDDEQEQKNISIENQKAIIEDYVKSHFPGSTLTFFEDRDRSDGDVKAFDQFGSPPFAATRAASWSWKTCATRACASSPSATAWTSPMTTTG